MHGNSTVVKSRKGKEYAVVLMDYLTNWPEMFAVKNQDTLTIAKLFSRKRLIGRGGNFCQPSSQKCIKCWISRKLIQWVTPAN